MQIALGTNGNSTQNLVNGVKRGKIRASEVTIVFGFPPDWLIKPHVCCDWVERIAWICLGGKMLELRKRKY